MLEKPGRDADPMAQLGYAFCQIADEKKEACIHCGNEWYVIHHIDGKCHECDKKGLPGLTEIENKKAQALLMRWMIGIAFMAILFMLYVRS